MSAPRAAAGAEAPSPAEVRRRFTLDPSVTFLNHGSFGACTREVQAHQAELRARMESEPVRFLIHELTRRIDEAREPVARFLGAEARDLVFVRNSTSAVNAVLGSLALDRGDELLTTDHVYGACRNALARVAARAGARVVTAHVPFPISDPGEVTAALVAAVTPRTRLALVDHITSPTGLVFPAADVVRALGERGVEVMVDGAHAPGMLPLALGELGAAYYAGNLHKWVCAPKGCAVLHVRRDRQEGLHPAVVSHGWSSERPRPRLWEEFDWTGTDDPTPWLAAPRALEVLEGLVPGGIAGLMERNRALARWTRDRLAAALGIGPPAPDSMIGALASVPLPPGEPHPSWERDPLWTALLERHRIQVPVLPWPEPPRRVLRVSCQAYVSRDDVERLASALPEALGGGPRTA